MKDDDDLLRALGNAARDEDWVEDPRLDALSAGELSEAEGQALRARDDPMADPAFEAFRPIDEAGKQRFVDAIVSQQQQGAGAKVLPFPKKRAWLASAGVVGALAAAAAFALVVSTGGPEPLPDYELDVLGGESGVRSKPTEGVPRLVEGSRLELRLRPATRTTGPLEVRGALARGDTVHPWSPPVHQDPDGAARIAGTREELFPDIPDGTWTIVVAIGRPDELPIDPRTLIEWEAGDDPPGTSLHRLSVQLGP